MNGLQLFISPILDKLTFLQGEIFRDKDRI